MTPESVKILEENDFLHPPSASGFGYGILENDAIYDLHNTMKSAILADPEMLSDAIDDYSAGHPNEWQSWLALWQAEAAMKRASSFGDFADQAADEYAANQIAREEI